jgi:RNA polymerase sigma factor (sigma-70 family)
MMQGQSRPLSAQQERELALAIAELDPASAEAGALRWELAGSAAFLVRREAHRMRHNPSLAVPDLMQEGWLGLLEAARRFDPARQLRFATYARWWVRAAMTQAIEAARLVRLPGSAAEQQRNLRKQIAIYERTGRPWTLSQLAQQMGLSLERVRLLLDAAGSLEPLDDAQDEIVLQDIAPDESAMATQQMQRLAEAVQSRLDQQQRSVILRLHGFGSDPWPLTQVARSMSLSRFRVRELQRQSLELLREACG